MSSNIQPDVIPAQSLMQTPGVSPQDAEMKRNASWQFGLAWLGLPPVEWSLALIGLCLFTFAIVTYWLPVGELGIALAAIGIVVQRRTMRIPFPIIIFGLLLAWAFMASLASPYSEIAQDKVYEQLKLLMIMLIIVNALHTEGQLSFYLLFFLGCFVLFPVRGTLVGGDDVMGRAVWNYIYHNPNDLATLTLIALGISCGFVFAAEQTRLVRFGAGISSLLLLVVIFLTQSRGAFIGLVAGLGWPLLRLGLKRPLRLILLGSVVAVAVGMTVPESVWVRLSGIEKLTSESTIGEADPEGSAEERFSIQKVAWQIVVDHPLLGVGLGTYPLENARYAPELGRRDTHNTYLNLAAELGIPGLLLWSALVLSVLRYAYRRRRQAGPGRLATQQAWIERALWGYLVAAIFGTYPALTFPYLMLGVLWCSASLLPGRPTQGANATPGAGS